jgi:hypothetical protein
MTKRPYIVKGTLVFLGYLWSAAKRTKKPISNELLLFHRDEQLHRLKQKFLKDQSG